MVDQETNRQMFAYPTEIGGSEVEAGLPRGGQHSDDCCPSALRFQPFDSLVLPREILGIYGAEP